MSNSSITTAVELAVRPRFELEPGVHRWKRTIDGAWLWVAVDWTGMIVGMRIVGAGQSHSIAVAELADMSGEYERPNLRVIGPDDPVEPVSSLGFSQLLVGARRRRILSPVQPAVE
jgi:hypothetical protein